MINIIKDDCLKGLTSLKLLVDVALLILFSNLKLNYFYKYTMTFFLKIKP
jgi:hypothetical protein